MQQNKNKKKNVRVFVLMNGMLAIALVVILLIHVAVANHAANQRYAMAQYLKTYQELQDRNQKLANEVAELQSTQRLMEESERLQLVQAARIHYIEPKSTVVFNQ